MEKKIPDMSGVVPKIQHINHQPPLKYTIKIFNKFPIYIGKLVLKKKYFIQNWKKYLIDKAFYSTEEFMNS